MKVNVKDATIRTAEVSLRFITVDAKRLTLSVFRQIPHEKIWNDDYSLRGIPWGIVRYAWGEGKDSIEFQVVWQSGDTLFRCEQSTRRDYSFMGDGEKTKLSLLTRDVNRARTRVEMLTSGVERMSTNIKRNQSSESQERSEAYLSKQEDSLADSIKSLRAFEAEIKATWAPALAQHAKWKSAFDDLAGLPQLYIAM